MSQPSRGLPAQPVCLADGCGAPAACAISDVPQPATYVTYSCQQRAHYQQQFARAQRACGGRLLMVGPVAGSGNASARV